MKRTFQGNQYHEVKTPAGNVYICITGSGTAYVTTKRESNDYDVLKVHGVPYHASCHFWLQMDGTWDNRDLTDGRRQWAHLSREDGQWRKPISSAAQIRAADIMCDALAAWVVKNPADYQRGVLREINNSIYSQDEELARLREKLAMAETERAVLQLREDNAKSILAQIERIAKVEAVVNAEVRP